MEKIFEFLKKHKLKILLVFLVFFFFRSCNYSTKVKKLEKTKTEYEITIKLQKDTIKTQGDIIETIPNLIKSSKNEIYDFCINWMGDKDRGSQIMEFYFVIRNRKDELNK